MTGSGRRRSRLTLVAALATGAILALAPLVSTQSCEATLDSTSCSSGHRSLLESEGSRILVVLAVPGLLALLPVLIPRRRATIGTAVALTTVMFVGIASVGMFLVPTVALAWFAATATRDAPAPAAVDS